MKAQSYRTKIHDTLDELNLSFVHDRIMPDAFRKVVKISFREKRDLRKFIFGKASMLRQRVLVNNIYLDISADPLDFFTASLLQNDFLNYWPGSKSFGSCTVLAMDRQTLVVRHIKNNKTKNIFWVHIDSCNNVLAVTPFGSSSVLRAFVKFAETKYGQKLHRIRPQLVNIVDQSYPQYFIDVHDQWWNCKFYSTKRSHDFKFELKTPNGLCLDCGRSTNRADGFCKKCTPQRITCQICRTRVHVDNAMCSENYVVCDTCYEHRIVLCARCGSEILIDQAQKVFDAENGVVFVCNDCLV